MFQLKDSPKQRMISYLAFYSIQAFNGLDEVHPDWGGQSVFSLLRAGSEGQRSGDRVVCRVISEARK